VAGRSSSAAAALKSEGAMIFQQHSAKRKCIGTENPILHDVIVDV